MNPQSPSSPEPGNGLGVSFDQGVAVIVGAVVETTPGAAPEVACRIGDQDGLEIVGGDGDRRLAVVWCSDAPKQLEKRMLRLVRTDDNILGIYPTFVGQDEEDDTQETAARRGALGGLGDDENR